LSLMASIRFPLSGVERPDGKDSPNDRFRE
jgi:hypothetical protein